MTGVVKIRLSLVIKFALTKPGNGRRFTPTGVGTTSRGAVLLGLQPVHPHGRGDHFHHSFYKIYGSGSPPRAWGPHGRRIGDAARRRFTPTGVGTTSQP